jgi:pimeloyl-ACP methyl ester carboxylesterase
LAADIASTYIVATQDRTVRPDWCRREAHRRLGANVVELAAGHCPHVSVPQELAIVLDSLA